MEPDPTVQKFRRRLETMSRDLTRYSNRRRLMGSHISDRLQTGEFRSKHRVPKGIERAEPRVFTVDDNVDCLDLRRIPPVLVTRSLGHALHRGEMRAIQSIHYAEAEFILVLDMSRSMLVGWFQYEKEYSTREPAQTKIEALYNASCAFAGVAEATRFSIRTLCVRKDFPMDYIRIPQNIIPRILNRMNHSLVKSYEDILGNPKEPEGFLLGKTLKWILDIRKQCHVVIVSDFLDELKFYEKELLELIARHNVVVLDVAFPFDYEFPFPPSYMVEFSRIYWRDWARHLEEGTTPRLLKRAKVKKWNEERQQDRNKLKTLCRRCSTPLYSLSNDSFLQCYQKALKLYHYIY